MKIAYEVKMNTTPYCCIAFLMQCPVHKTKIKQKENTDKPVTKVFYFISARLAPQYSGPKRPKSLSTLNLKLPYIKGLSFSKQVFVKDILFFNIKAPTQELRLHLI